MENHIQNVLDLNYTLYDKDPNRDLTNPDTVRLHERHFQEDNADFWRQARLMEPLFKCMLYARHDSWLTVGDGAYGLEAVRMARRGYTNVLPTDICETLLKVSKERGHIADYRVENAERLSFGDNSFDYVLCKDSYHHFPRPMIALYEMLRVARKAVVLIEPQDKHSDYPVVPGPAVAGYETVGNYIYTVSRRELQKVALGLDLPAVAFKNIFDFCIDGLEYVEASESNPAFVNFVNLVNSFEEQCRNGQRKHNMLLAVIFKQRPDQQVVDSFLNGVDGWSITSFPGNPHLKPNEGGVAP